MSVKAPYTYIGIDQSVFVFASGNLGKKKRIRIIKYGARRVLRSKERGMDVSGITTRKVARNELERQFGIKAKMKRK